MAQPRTKTNESYYGQKKLLHDGRPRRHRRRDRKGGISRRCFFAYPSLSGFLAIAQWRIALLLARRRAALSALDRFYAQRAFGLPMAERSQIFNQEGTTGLSPGGSRLWPVGPGEHSPGFTLGDSPHPS